MKRLIAAFMLWLSADYAHGEYLYSISGNMAGAGHTWGMSDLGVSNPNALKINGVFYRYTPIKNTDDDMLVHVRNKQVGGGYIFSVTDDWSGLPGGVPITKGFIIDNLPIELWGDGSIDVDGNGSVADASVIYSYKYNNDCMTPLSDPSCPGYIDAVLAMMDTGGSSYDPLEDENIIAELARKAELDDDDIDNEEEEVSDEDRIERILSGVDTSILSANIIAQDLLMYAMTSNTTMNPYYNKELSGGAYKETITLKDGNLPDNKKGARVGLAQQILHTEMVNMQYSRKE